MNFANRGPEITGICLRILRTRIYEFRPTISSYSSPDRPPDSNKILTWRVMRPLKFARSVILRKMFGLPIPYLTLSRKVLRRFGLGFMKGYFVFAV